MFFTSHMCTMLSYSGRIHTILCLISIRYRRLNVNMSPDELLPVAMTSFLKSQQIMKLRLCSDVLTSEKQMLGLILRTTRFSLRISTPVFVPVNKSTCWRVILISLRHVISSVAGVFIWYYLPLNLQCQHFEMIQLLRVISSIENDVVIASKANVRVFKVFVDQLFFFFYKICIK